MNQSGCAPRVRTDGPRIARGEPHIRSAAGKCVKGKRATTPVARRTAKQDDVGRRRVPARDKGTVMLGTILLIILILLLLGALPSWGYSRSWGYGPSGLLGIIIIIVIVLWVLGRI